MFLFKTDYFNFLNILIFLFYVFLFVEIILIFYLIRNKHKTIIYLNKNLISYTTKHVNQLIWHEIILTLLMILNLNLYNCVKYF